MTNRFITDRRIDQREIKNKYCTPERKKKIVQWSLHHRNQVPIVPTWMSGCPFLFSGLRSDMQMRTLSGPKEVPPLGTKCHCTLWLRTPLSPEKVTPLGSKCHPILWMRTLSSPENFPVCVPNVMHWNKILRHQSEGRCRAASIRESSSSWTLHIAFILVLFLSEMQRQMPPSVGKECKGMANILKQACIFPYM